MIAPQEVAILRAERKRHWSDRRWFDVSYYATQTDRGSRFHDGSIEHANTMSGEINACLSS